MPIDLSLNHYQLNDLIPLRAWHEAGHSLSLDKKSAPIALKFQCHCQFSEAHFYINMSGYKKIEKVADIDVFFCMQIF